MISHDQALSFATSLEMSRVFEGLGAHVLERIAPCFHKVSFEKEEVVFREGDPCGGLYIVIQGEFSIFQDMGWGQRELLRVGPGDVFGEMALISHEARAATVRATRPSECFMMDEAAFNSLLEKEPPFAHRVLTLLTQRLRQSDEVAGRDILRAYQALVFSLAQLTESRDPETGMHIHRVREYCVMLSERLAEYPQMRDIVTPDFVRSIYFVSPLHDIGKVAIPDSILLKPGKLTEEEFRIMQTHSRLGAEALQTVLGFCDHETFRMAHRVVLHHHERFDGKGYPNGLVGEAIPIEARIMGLADTFDALLSRRVYKDPFSFDQTRDEIVRSSGSRFDPLLVETMIKHLDDFHAVHLHYDA